MSAEAEPMKDWMWCFNYSHAAAKRIAELERKLGFAQASYDSCCAQYNILESQLADRDRQIEALREALK
jgi:hypothetical protein